MSTTNNSRTKLVEELNQAVQRNGNLTVLFTHSIAEQIGLSATEFEALDVLGQTGPVTAGQLAQLCGLSTGGVTGMVDRLEKAGFVRRAHDPDDRRKVIIERVPNETLHERVRKLYAPLSAGFHQLVSHYSDAEIELILDFVNRNSAMVEQVQADFKGH
jgi:DNA-binding MarR family transcriptional regulator